MEDKKKKNPVPGTVLDDSQFLRYEKELQEAFEDVPEAEEKKG